MKPRIALAVLGIVGAGFAAVAAADPGDEINIESGYVEVKGGRIFYEAAGEGPAVVFTHDGLLHRETWNHQFEVFAKDHRVIRWDRRGYGKSDEALFFREEGADEGGTEDE